jgi:hypothetical protein
MPPAFEAYARLLHPPYYANGNPSAVRWLELAERNGVDLGPEVGFRGVSAIELTDQARWSEAVPNEGSLEREQVAALTGILAPFTETPDRCWVAAWVGWGNWRPGRSSTILASTEADIHRLSVELEPAKVDAWLATIPQFGIHAREYFLFAAHLSDVPAFAIGGWHQSPSIWWSEDRAWCVVTEVDGFSSYVGGSAACIEAVGASDDIEAIKATADVGMDLGHY